MTDDSIPDFDGIVEIKITPEIHMWLNNSVSAGFKMVSGFFTNAEYIHILFTKFINFILSFPKDTTVEWPRNPLSDVTTT